MHSKGSDQTGLSLRWVHSHFVGFVLRQLIYGDFNCLSGGEAWIKESVMEVTVWHHKAYRVMLNKLSIVTEFSVHF